MWTRLQAECLTSPVFQNEVTGAAGKQLPWRRTAERLLGLRRLFCNRLVWQLILFNLFMWSQWSSFLEACQRYPSCYLSH